MNIRTWLPAVALALAMAACGSGDAGGGPPNPVEGLIVGLAGDEMTLEATDGGTYGFELADPNVTFEHLEVHRNDKLPVSVTWTGSGDARVATTIADA